MEVMLLEDAVRKEKQKIAELDKALREHGVEINVEDSSNSIRLNKTEWQEQSRKCDTDKVNTRTKDSTMPT